MSFISTPKLVDEAGRLAALYRYEILDTDPEREFAEIIGLVKSLLDVPMAAITFIDAERQWIKAAAGFDGEGEAPRSITFCDHTIRSTEPLVLEDAARDPRFADNPFVVVEAGIRCYLGVPLTTPEGYNVGSLCVFGTEPRRFSDADRAVLANFARLVITQLELRLLARRDGLTGVLTRRAFEANLRAALETAKDGDTTCSLLLLDLDHFKFVNDRFGHPAGDEVLRATAEAIQSELSPGDSVGRLGGEEFGVLLKEIGPERASRCAEAIRRKVMALRLPCLEGHIVTLSCGVARWENGHPGVEGWLAAADVALYAAKRNGRNQVVLAA